MYELAIYKDAQDELRALLEEGAAWAGEIAAFLGELADHQGMLSRLNERDFEDDRINVDHFIAMQRTGWNVWRLKLFNLEPDPRLIPYRIIYAFDGPQRTFHVLAIMHRGVDYERNADFIERAYEDLGIKQLPR